ncbi:hypothetical protein Rhe02_09540 [Rhizocola hellebori]|uniref:Uncharacterized protein n=1 Tax=Rhizocola hellebori TaxID=1392758 RepID=A0A8J3Q3W9_9ACTN|nr:hypothetical protein Rhe02_09540 [Rhizocola hellebori]
MGTGKADQHWLSQGGEGGFQLRHVVGKDKGRFHGKVPPDMDSADG